MYVRTYVHTYIHMYTCGERSGCNRSISGQPDLCKYVHMYCGTIGQGAIGQAAQEWWLCCVWAEPPYNRSGCNRSGYNRSGCPAPRSGGYTVCGQNHPTIGQGAIGQGAIGQAAQEWWLCCVWAEPPYNRQNHPSIGQGAIGQGAIGQAAQEWWLWCVWALGNAWEKVEVSLSKCRTTYVCVRMCMYVCVLTSIISLVI